MHDANNAAQIWQNTFQATNAAPRPPKHDIQFVTKGVL